MQAFGYEMAQRRGRLQSRAEVASESYESTFLSIVAMGRERVGKLVDATDADIF